MKLTKRFISVIISLAMLCSMLVSVPVFAATVCKADGKNFDTLRAAIEYANEKSGHTTITITADLNVTSKIVIKNDITITDDGKAHTIRIYNTSTSEDPFDSGKGFHQVEDAKGLFEITATAKGRLTIEGKHNSYSTYNRNALFYL